jgi:ribosome recycling factor
MIEEVLSELRNSTSKTLEGLKRELGKLRTGRAHAGMLDGVRVEYYGQLTPISQMATISVPEPRLLMVKPWERSQVQATLA